MSLKCYERDWHENANAWKRHCDFQQANKVVKKLRRHFKVPWECNGMAADFIKKQRKGTASYYTNRITLPSKNISLGMIAHEIAHLVHKKRYNDHGHNKKFMKALKIVNNYVKYQNYYDSIIDWKIESKHRKYEAFIFDNFQTAFAALTA